MAIARSPTHQTSTSSDSLTRPAKKHSRSTSTSSLSMNESNHQPNPTISTNHSSKRFKLQSNQFIPLISNNLTHRDDHQTNHNPSTLSSSSSPSSSSSSSSSSDTKTNQKTITPATTTTRDSDGDRPNGSESETKSESEPTSESGWTTITKAMKKKNQKINDYSTDNINDKITKSKLKKQGKLAQKLIDNPAEFHFDTRGFRYGRMIQLKDVRDLVLSIMADERNQEWMLVKNKSSIKKMVVLMIPGLTPESLGVTKPDNTSIMPFPITSQNSQLPVFQSLFSHACPTKAGGDRLRMFSCLNVFLTCQLSAMAKAKRDEERKKSSINGLTMDPTIYLLSTELMVEQDYPSLHYSTSFSASERQLARLKEPIPDEDLSSNERPPFEAWMTHPTPDFIQTPIYPDSSLGRPLKILGIDCEMCVTASGSELTRCTIVDSNEKLVYDQLVLPDQPITDYLTKFSGITEERLKGITTRLIDVQKKLSELIDFNTVLVGHSLDCDLRALKIAHPWVIDTSVLYQHPRGLPMKPSLKWLASKWLGRDIQSNGLPNGGHDSEEDARTAIQLLKKKIQKGPGFGEFTPDNESIFERMSRGQQPKRCAFVDFGSTNPNSNGGGNSEVTSKTVHPLVIKNNWKNVDSFIFNSDKKVGNGIISALNDHDFVFGRFMELSHALEWTQHQSTKKEGDEMAGVKEEERTEEDKGKELKKVYKSLNETIERLNERLPKGTSLIIFNGHSDPRTMAELNLKKNRFEKSFMLATNITHSQRQAGAQHQKMNSYHLNRSCSNMNHSISSTLISLSTINTTPLVHQDHLIDDHKNSSPVDHPDPQSHSWSNQDERDLADAVEKCKIGFSFYRIK